MIPGIVHAAIDERAQPFFGQQVADVGLAEAGGDSSEQFVFDAVIESAQRAREHVLFSTAFVADDLGAFDAHQRRHIAELPQIFCDLFGDQLTIGKDLEEAIWMLREEVEQLRMHEGFTAKNAEEAVAVGLCLIHESIQLIEFNLHLWLVDIDPAALAAEIAGVQNRNVEKRREVLAALHPIFVQLHRARPFKSEIPRHLQQKAGIGGAQNTAAELKYHKVGAT